MHANALASFSSHFARGEEPGMHASAAHPPEAHSGLAPGSARCMTRQVRNWRQYEEESSDLAGMIMQFIDAVKFIRFRENSIDAQTGVLI
jgi:hypothetical protein